MLQDNAVVPDRTGKTPCDYINIYIYIYVCVCVCCKVTLLLLTAWLAAKLLKSHRQNARPTKRHKKKGNAVAPDGMASPKVTEVLPPECSIHEASLDKQLAGHSSLLTPWCRVLLEKLTGLQLVKKFPVFHGTRMFITALTIVRQPSLS